MTPLAHDTDGVNAMKRQNEVCGIYEEKVSLTYWVEIKF